MAADRYDERYRNDAYRGERGHARDERGFIDRAGDQVRSWFGHEDAGRRHHLDERDRGRAYSDDRYGGRSVRDQSPDYGYGWASETHGRYPLSERGPVAESERWNIDDGRVEYDRSGATSRGWNEPNYGYRPSYGYGYGEWSTPRSRLGESRHTGESRGFYEDPRGRVHEFEHEEGDGFAGRGPRGYRRSDERIREDVCDRLADDPRIDASDVEVTVNQGEVILSGTIHSRQEKRTSEDLIETISGVRDIQNNLRVSRWQGPQDTGAGTSARSSEGSTAGTRLEKR